MLSAGTYKGRVGGNAYGFNTPDLAGLGNVVPLVPRRVEVRGPIWTHSTEEMYHELARRKMGLAGEGPTQFPRQTLTLGACRDPGLAGLGLIITVPVSLGLGAFLWARGRKRRKPWLSYAGAAVAAYPFASYWWNFCRGT